MIRPCPKEGSAYQYPDLECQFCSNQNVKYYKSAVAMQWASNNQVQEHLRRLDLYRKRCQIETA